MLKRDVLILVQYVDKCRRFLLLIFFFSGEAIVARLLGLPMSRDAPCLTPLNSTAPLRPKSGLAWEGGCHGDWSLYE